MRDTPCVLCALLESTLRVQSVVCLLFGKYNAWLLFDIHIEVCRSKVTVRKQMAVIEYKVVNHNE
jgi:hypothetical protein